MSDTKSRPFDVVTPETQAKTAVERWAYRYSLSSTVRTREIGRRLSLLKTPSITEVDAIIGNRSWTATKCNHCGAERVPVVRFGDAGDYPADICRECLAGALAALDGAQ